MKTKLYYVIEKKTETYQEFDECTGWKDVTVYRIEDNEIKKVVIIEIENQDNSIEAIIDYLVENDPNEDEFTEDLYEFIQL